MATDAIPELEFHLKALCPAIREVNISLRNPIPPPDSVTRASYLHDATLALVFKGKAVTAPVIAAIMQEAIGFLKQRVKRIRPGYTRCRRGGIRRARDVVVKGRYGKGTHTTCKECGRMIFLTEVEVTVRDGKRWLELTCLQPDCVVYTKPVLYDEGTLEIHGAGAGE